MNEICASRLSLKTGFPTMFTRDSTEVPICIQSIYPLLTKAVKLLCVYIEYINMVQMFRLAGFLLHSSVPFKHASLFFFISETGKTHNRSTIEWDDRQNQKWYGGFYWNLYNTRYYSVIAVYCRGIINVDLDYVIYTSYTCNCNTYLINKCINDIVRFHNI